MNTIYIYYIEIKGTIISVLEWGKGRKKEKTKEGARKRHTHTYIYIYIRANIYTDVLYIKLCINYIISYIVIDDDDDENC